MKRIIRGEPGRPKERVLQKGKVIGEAAGEKVPISAS